MRKELQDKILAVCPNLVFSENIWSGFACGDGWFDLLFDLFAELNGLPNIQETHIVQCKQKLGELRVYYSPQTMERCERGGDPLIEEIIQKAGDRAKVACEECGAVGLMVVSRFGGLRVSCKTHREPGDRERNPTHSSV